MREVLLSFWRRADHRVLAPLTGVVLLLHVAPAAAQSFDHSDFDRLLRAHVTAEGLVDYDAFDRSPESLAYKAALAGANIAALPPGERLALWINAYNAYTIDLINKHDERRSIRNINRTLGFLKGKGPWWFPEDFGADARELLGYLAAFFPAGPERELLERGDLRIAYTDYDWTLNSQDHASNGH